MDNKTLFYVCGIVLALSALIVSFVGLKLKNFPGRALPLVIVWFAIFVLGATTFAVRYGTEEQEERAPEYAKAAKEYEEEQANAFLGTEGAQGGESEKGEEEAEKGAEAKEGSAEGEPVGPSEGSQEGKSGKSGQAAGASTTLDLAADATDLAFDQTELSAEAGEVTIDFTNPSPIPHNVVIDEEGKELAGFDPIAEGEESLSAELEPGTYTFFCSVPGHRQAGMEGTLTVK